MSELFHEFLSTNFTITQEIKKQMKYITKSNNEDGIYEYLQKLDLV